MNGNKRSSLSFQSLNPNFQAQDAFQAFALVHVADVGDDRAGADFRTAPSQQHEALRQESGGRVRLHQDEDDRVQGAPPREDRRQVKML